MSTAPFQTLAERKEKQNANVKPVIPRQPVVNNANWQTAQQQQFTNQTWTPQNYDENYPPLAQPQNQQQAQPQWQYYQNAAPNYQVPYVQMPAGPRARGRGRGRGRGARMQQQQLQQPVAGQVAYPYAQAVYQAPPDFATGRGRGGGPRPRPYTRRGPPPVGQPQFQQPQMTMQRAQFAPQATQMPSAPPQAQQPSIPQNTAQQPTVVQSATNLAPQASISMANQDQNQNVGNQNQFDPRRYKINVSVEELAMLNQLRGRHQD